MDEDVDAAAEPVVDPADGGLEVGAEVGGGGVEDVEAVALELDTLCGVCVDGGQPGRIEHLHEGTDGVRLEQRRVEDGREGAEEKCAGP